jgi:hypothetical protein
MMVEGRRLRVEFEMCLCCDLCFSSLGVRVGVELVVDEEESQAGQSSFLVDLRALREPGSAELGGSSLVGMVHPLSSGAGSAATPHALGAAFGGSVERSHAFDVAFASGKTSHGLGVVYGSAETLRGLEAAFDSFQAVHEFDAALDCFHASHALGVAFRSVTFNDVGPLDADSGSAETSHELGVVASERSHEVGDTFDSIVVSQSLTFGPGGVAALELTRLLRDFFNSFAVSLSRLDLF